MAHNFFIAYKVPDNAFLKAARTWKQDKLSRDDACEQIEIASIVDLKVAFRTLLDASEKRKAPYRYGALFVHSSPPLPNTPDNSPKRGIHTSPFQPKTLAELRYREEYLTPSGQVDTASIELIRGLPKLPWTKDGTLWVYGCLSGDAPDGKSSIAQVLADGQGVKTVGMIGKAYFSSDPVVYKETKQADQRVYLKSYMKGVNWILTPFASGSKMALPEKEFMPKPTQNK